MKITPREKGETRREERKMSPRSVSLALLSLSKNGDYSWSTARSPRLAEQATESEKLAFNCPHVQCNQTFVLLYFLILCVSLIRLPREI